ncbi:BspA family leucine-rich repeat surface protein [Companilactobacillus huachuanensis]|uniref:BspA family leucine-rich repeat surface protein n=1 Tax=Companilactobacillus huachuanensis TaxID=2559914 RepID=A0ABW1RNS0_9LACO|nr:BspA family leucine-rich repeat surface protein [Companilactobacillus huachuanensis]
MRFQQLKRNPNNILKKKLVKSGKNWIVIASLSIIGGILFMSPTTVKADVASTQQPIVQNDNINSQPTETTQTPVAETTPSAPTSNQPTPTQPETPVAAKTNLNLEPAEKEITPTQPQQVPNQTQQPQTQDQQVLDQNTQVADPVDSTNSVTPPSGMDGTVVHQGVDGTSPYFITDKGTLYFTDGTLDSSTTKKIGDTYLNITAIDTSLASPNSVYAPVDSSYLFAGNVNNTNWSGMKSMNLSNLNTSKVTNMSHMLSILTGLTSIDVSNFDTSNVTDMSYMFDASPHISSLNLNNFDTSKVTNMSYMFNDLINLKELHLASFDTSNVTADNMKQIFDIAETSEIELGPNADFSKATPGYPYFYVPQEGPTDGMMASYWINKEGTLKFDSTHLLTDYKAKPGETETFVMGGLHYYMYTYLNENDYLNGKLYSSSPVYSLAILSKDMLQSDLDKVQNTDIPSAWKLDSEKSNLTTSNPDMSASIDVLKQMISESFPKYKDWPINLENLAIIFRKTFTNSIDKTFTLNMYYTGSLPSSNSGSSHDYLPITSLIQTVATFADKPAVQLWSFDRNTSAITQVTNRELSPDSGWYSDRMVTVDKINYLRVATNEWVKASDVYRYVANSTNVSVNNNSQGFAPLFKAEGTNVTDRTLNNDSNWYSDYIAYLGNTDDIKQTNDIQDKYYRVATNEFVSANDVTTE